LRRVVRFAAADVRPDVAAVLRSQGLPERPELRARLRELLDSALELCETLAEPTGLLDEISRDDFGVVFDGEGGNAPETPLASIFPRADALALFAATLGEPISLKLRELFDQNDLALAYMLDSAASETADGLATALAIRYRSALAERGMSSGELGVLPYSPGYCGWHVSGQARLFDRLRPAEIGIALNSSFLMQPLKSVSGVLVAGMREIHSFSPEFPFCADCATQACQARMAANPSLA